MQKDMIIFSIVLILIKKRGVIIAEWIKNLTKAIRFIEDNLTNDINIEDVSKQALLPSSRFQSVFNAVTGIIVNEYIRNATDNDERHGIDDWNYDYEEKKQRFWEDNGFGFYTDARYNQFIKIFKPLDEVYNSSRYRFTLLDGSMDGVSFRFFGVNNLDFYDGQMIAWRVTDCNFSNALIYDSWMGNSKFYDTCLDDNDFRYGAFSRSKFSEVSFEDCKFESCDISGMTIDGISVKDALEFYKMHT